MSLNSQNDPIPLRPSAWTLPTWAEKSLAPANADEQMVLYQLSRRMEPVSRTALEALAKRGFDIAVSLGVLLALSPMLIVIVFMVKISSQGPIFFTQTRVGRGGRLFRMIKFRSMVTDAEDRKAALAELNEKDGPIFKMKSDPRVTPVGRFLRKWSLDELPQLLNVLKGDMSVVGPRPPTPNEVVKYEEWQLRRLTVTPGLTCIWQTSGRSRITFEEWMRMDLRYIDEWSLALDAKLVAKTVKTVLLADGAY